MRIVKKQIVMEKKRVDGSTIRVAEVVVGDETATVVMRAMNGTNDRCRASGDSNIVYH